MTVRIWNGASAPLTTAADWSPAGAPQAGDSGVVAAGQVQADGMALDGFTLRLDGSGANPSSLEMTGGSLGAGMRVITTTGHVGTLALGGTVDHAGHISAGAGAALGLHFADVTSELVNTGVLAAASGGALASNGGQIVNNGVIVANGGVLNLNTQITGAGKILVNGGNLTLGQIVGSFQTLNLNGGGVTLDQPFRFLATVAGWNSSGTLDLAHTHLTGATVAGGVLTLRDGSFTEAQIHLAGHYSTADFSVSNLANGDALVTTSHV